MGHPHGLPVDPDAGRGARPKVVAAIAAGGALGAPARYALSRIVHVAPGTFPWSTLWTNVSGSFLLGVLVTVIVERFPPTKYVRPFAAIGFLGAYTTFSTFAVEADVLVKDGHAGIAVAYVVTSLVVGIAAAWAGIAAGGAAMIVVGLLVAGAIGAPLRYVVDARVGRAPWGTFVINVTGSFVLGLITGAALYHGFPNTPKVILGTGLCGAYTTFSTFSFETVRLVEEGEVWAAARYVLASTIVGLAAAAAGLALAAL